MSDTFKFKIYTKGKILIEEVEIPQSCVLALDGRTTSEGVLTLKLDKLGQAIKETCEQKAQEKVQEYDEAVSEYEHQTSNKTYFQRQKEHKSWRHLLSEEVK